MKGFVYYGSLDAENLKKFIEDFFKNQQTICHIAKDIDIYELKEGLPLKITKMGQVFSEKGELRWKENRGEYSVTLLTENEMNDMHLGLTRVEGNWITSKKEYLLVRSDAPHISPKFDKYPKGARYLEVSIYYKNGAATFVSPRRFKV